MCGSLAGCPLMPRRVCLRRDSGGGSYIWEHNRGDKASEVSRESCCCTFRQDRSAPLRPHEEAKPRLSYFQVCLTVAADPFEHHGPIRAWRNLGCTDISD